MALPYQKIITANPYRNRGATVFYGGNVPVTSTNPNVTKVMGRADLGAGSRKHGSQIVASTTTGVGKALTLGDLAKMTKGRYIIMGKTDFVAGLANTALNRPASGQPKTSVHFAESNRTTRQITAGYNYVTGRFLVTPQPANDSFGQDQSARVSRAIPGEFQVIETGKSVKLKDYPLKTG